LSIATKGKQVLNRYLPLSTYQSDLCEVQKAFPGSALMNVGGYAEIDGQADTVVLQDAINRLILSHDSLRISLVHDGNDIFQIFTPFVRRDVSIRSFAHEHSPMQSAIKWMENESTIPVLLQTGAELYSIEILIIDKTKKLVFIKSHHLLLDGWSFSILFKSLCTIYNKRIHGALHDDLEPMSYRILLEKEKQYKASGSFDADKVFWTSYALKNQKCFENGLQNKYEYAKKTLKNVMSRRVPNKTELQQILSFTNQYNLSEVHVYLAAFCKFIFLKTGLDAMVAGIPVLNRSNFKERNVAGLFANVLPLAVNDLPGLPFLDYIGYINRCVRDIYRHCQMSTHHIFACTDNPFPLGRIDCSFSFEILDDSTSMKNNTVRVDAVHCRDEEYPISLILRKRSISGEVEILFSCQEIYQRELGCFISMAQEYMICLNNLIDKNTIPVCVAQNSPDFKYLYS
jgi:syringomycin synthetase protein SyrE